MVGSGSPSRAPLRDPTALEVRAERIASTLDLPITLGGVVFVLVIVADNITPAHSRLDIVWVIAGWLLWALFAFEFVLRLVVARSTAAFLRRNWWQLIFLVVPFLRFLRAFSRGARVGRLLSASVRSTRTAGQALAGRVAWLAGVAVATILGASEVLYAYGPGLSYPRALHDAALGAIGGEPIEASGAVADVVEVLLAIHATVVFAALAGSLGAFFLERRSPAPIAAR